MLSSLKASSWLDDQAWWLQTYLAPRALWTCCVLFVTVCLCLCVGVWVGGGGGATVTTSAYLQKAASTQDREWNKDTPERETPLLMCTFAWIVCLHARIFLFVYRRERMKHGMVSLEPHCIYMYRVITSLSSAPECTRQHVHRFTSGGAVPQRDPPVIAVAAVNMNSGALSSCLKR